MQGLIGKKIGMTTFFAEDGAAIPVTVIQAGPCPVVQIKTSEKEGYNAIQLGFEEIKPKTTTVVKNRKKVKKQIRPNRPIEGHFKRAGVKAMRHLHEFRIEDVSAYELGQEISVELFADNEIVDVQGTTKGRGFAGFMKRWNFGGGRTSHGSMFHRRAGSVGGSSSPSRIFKNKKMPGHYGSEQVSVQNVRVVKVDPERNVILIRGGVPGANGNIVLVRKASKG